MGQSPPSTQYSYIPDEGLPFLQGTADFGSYSPKPQVYCVTPTKIASKDDILFSVRAPVGELNIAAQDCGIGRGICAIRPFSKLNHHFAWWALHEARGFLNQVSTGSTYEAVTAEDVANLLISDINFSRQRSIADFLDRETARIDALIAAKERLLELLAEKRRALITHAVTRGLDPSVPLRDSGIPWLGNIPRHWKTERAKYLFSQSKLMVNSEDEIVTCFRDGQVTLRRNRREEGFTNADIEAGYQGIKVGQLVLHSMDAFAGAIGVSESDGKCSPEYIICDPTVSSVDIRYYGILLRIMAISGYIQAICPAVRERAPRIRFSDFREIELPVPPIDEQHSIVSEIIKRTSTLDALRSATERSVGLLKERRAALISEAVTGKIEVSGR